MTGTLASSAQTILLTKNGRVDVNGSLGYWRDTTAALPYESIKNIQFSTYQSSYSPNIAFDRSAHWFKVEITNQSQTPEWLMEVAYAPLDQIDFYVVGSDGNLIHKVSGDHFPIAQRDLAHRHPIFAFSITPGESTVIYLRVQSISSVQVPITFWHRDAFLKTSYSIQLLNGLFYGAMLLMILYQLFLFFSIRERIA